MACSANPIDMDPVRGHSLQRNAIRHAAGQSSVHRGRDRVRRVGHAGYVLFILGISLLPTSLLTDSCIRGGVAMRKSAKKHYLSLMHSFSENITINHILPDC